MKKLLSTGILFAAIASSALAQVSYTTFGTNYTQDFDSLANTGSNQTLFTDNVTLIGWHARSINTGYGGSGAFVFTMNGTENTAADEYLPSNGSSGTGELYSFGNDTDTDRAFGSVASGTPHDFFIGLQIQNNTGFDITQFTLSYDGEQWRRGNNSPQRAEDLLVYYRIGGTTFDSIGSWNSISALTFTSPNIGSTTASALDGNAVGNATRGLTATISATIPNGTQLWFAWVDLDQTGTDHGMAIDNVVFSAIPEPTTFVAVLSSVGGLLLLRRRRA